LVEQFRDPAVAYFIDRVGEEDDKMLDALQEAIEHRKATDKK
jgi:hypothetical protein